MHIGVVGINHKLANLNTREQLAKICQKRFGVKNSCHLLHTFVLLSTCNRTEIYFSSEDLAQTHTYIINCLRHEIDEEFDQKLYSYFGQDCFQHLSRVTSGLDSAIVAETEIQGQVKKAYEETMRYIRLPSELHFLFQKALKVGKKIRSTFPLGRGIPDLEHAVFQIGVNFFQEAVSCKVLFVGASEINRKLLCYFKSKQMKDITICNRTHWKIEGLVKNQEIKSLPWQEINRWDEYDWIIFGTKAQEPILTPHLIPDTIKKDKLIHDLSVPRNVDIGKVKGIRVFNIDQINESLKIRKQRIFHSLEQAEKIVTNSSKRQVDIFISKQMKKPIPALISA